jgi:outer membrane protein TolC
MPDRLVIWRATRLTLAAIGAATTLAPLHARADGHDAPETTASAPEAAHEALAWDAFATAVEAVHPLMEAARAGLDGLKARLSQAEWAWFPMLRMTAGAGLVPKITGNAVDSNADWSTFGPLLDARLEIAQPLWTFGRIEALQRAATAGVDVGHAGIAVARWELRMRAAEAFFSAALARELDTLLGEGQVWIAKAEARMESQRDAEAPEYDQLEHLRLKTRIAEFHELRTRNELLGVTARAGMRVLLQRPEGGPEPVPEGDLAPLELPLHDAQVYVDLARRNDPGLQLARARAGAARELAGWRRTELWPNLVLAGDVRSTRAPTVEPQDSIFANDPFNRTFGGLALGLEWRLDVPQRLLVADEARAAARRAEAEAEVQADLMEVNVRRLVQDLKNQRELLDVYRGSRKAAQGWLTATWDTYESGFGSFRDVMDALVQFYEKRLGYLQVVHAHNLAVFRLSQAVGVDVRLIPAAR